MKTVAFSESPDAPPPGMSRPYFSFPRIFPIAKLMACRLVQAVSLPGIVTTLSSDVGIQPMRIVSNYGFVQFICVSRIENKA